MAGKLESAANADTMRGEKLVGRTQQMFFSPEEDEIFFIPGRGGGGFDKKESFDAADMDARSINAKIAALMADGVGDITLKNPGAKHSLAVGC